MKNLVSAIRRNADAYELPRKAQVESDSAAFRRKFAAAFGSRPADPAPDGENPPQDKPEPSKRKTARGKTGKR